MLASSVNDNMLWTVASVSDDGVISLRNAGNGRYLNLNNADASSRSWGISSFVISPITVLFRSFTGKT